MKKRLFSILLVMSIMLSMSVTVFGMDHEDPYAPAKAPAYTLNR